MSNQSVDEKTLLRHEKDIDFKTFCKYNKLFMKEGFMQIFAYGNIDEESTIKITKMCESKLNMKPQKLSDLTTERTLQIDNEITLEIPVDDLDNSNHAILQYY